MVTPTPSLSAYPHHAAPAPGYVPVYGTTGGSLSHPIWSSPTPSTGTISCAVAAENAAASGPTDSANLLRPSPLNYGKTILSTAGVPGSCESSCATGKCSLF